MAGFKSLIFKTPSRGGKRRYGNRSSSRRR